LRLFFLPPPAAVKKMENDLPSSELVPFRLGDGAVPPFSFPFFLLPIILLATFFFGVIGSRRILLSQASERY